MPVDFIEHGNYQSTKQIWIVDHFVRELSPLDFVNIDSSITQEIWN